MFRAEDFVREAVEHIRTLPIDCAVAAISGGVDSTTSALIARLALGNRLKAVFLDTGFMRLGEAEAVASLLKGLLDVEVVDARAKFYEALMGIGDAESKRVTFRRVFYETLSNLVKSRGCGWLVQGTIAPDWIETKGGIKTQHNVLEQVGLDTERLFGFRVIEPLRELYKDQVREVAAYLGVPREIINRQPFPGPGLSIRAVGTLTMDKLELARIANWVVERELGNLGLSQWFAAVWENEYVFNEELTRRVSGHGNLEIHLFKVMATGVKGDSRAYGPVALVRGRVKDWGSIYELHSLVVPGTEVTHLVYELGQGDGRYFVSVRAVVTEDFMTADVARLSKDTLEKVAHRLLEIGDVGGVGFDITPKPPATIEYE